MVRVHHGPHTHPPNPTGQGPRATAGGDAAGAAAVLHLPSPGTSDGSLRDRSAFSQCERCVHRGAHERGRGPRPQGGTTARLVVTASSEDTIAAPGNRQPNYVVVSATDANGVPVTGLGPANFKVDPMVVAAGARS